MPQAGRVAFGKMKAVTFGNRCVGLFERVPPRTPRRAVSDDVAESLVYRGKFTGMLCAK
jgi:hypothetical protein